MSYDISYDNVCESGSRDVKFSRPTWSRDQFNGLVVVVLVLVLVLIIIVLVLMHLGLVVSKFDYAKYLLLLANQFDCVTDTSKTAKIIKKVILFNSTLTVRRCDGE